MTKSRQGTAVAAGGVAHQNLGMHRFSGKLTCALAVMTTGAGEVDCTFGARHSFRISPTLVGVQNEVARRVVLPPLALARYPAARAACAAMGG